jgi:hypothetical protein
MVEVAKSVYLAMNSEQRRTFVEAIPRALYAFSAQDFTVWRTILRATGYARADAIVDDCEHTADSGMLVRDFSGIRRLVRELEIGDLVDVDGTAPPGPGPA